MQLYKKPTRPTQYFIISTFLLALAGCSPKPKDTKLSCELDLNQCLTMSTQNSEIRFNTRAVIVEQNYEMTLLSKLPIKSAKLEGINMSMGIIPVVVEAQENEAGSERYLYTASIFLGMCSEPKMQWMLTLTFDNGQSESTVFDSYWQAPENMYPRSLKQAG